MIDKINDYFKNQEASLLASAKAAGLLTAPSTVGRSREDLLKEFFRNHLPTRLSAVRGEVIDSTGKSSGEVDAIFLDHESNAFRIGGESVVPVEACVGICEVKTSLAGPDLENSIRKVARVKHLIRAEYHGFYRRGHGDELIEIPPRRPNAYIVAYDGLSWNTLLRQICDNPPWFEGDFMIYGPEIICILGRGFAFKNDRHLFNAPVGREHWALVLREDLPGLQQVLHHVQETISRYGTLTYELGGYHG